MKIVYTLEERPGDILLFQILEMDASFIGKRYKTTKGFEIISHPNVACSLGGKRAYVRNGIKELDYNISVLYFKDNEKLVAYKELLQESLRECFNGES